MLGTIELHKYDNVMFCCLCTDFDLRSRQMNMEETEILASKAASGWVLVLLVGSSEYDRLQLIALPDQEHAARGGGDTLLWHQVHVWTQQRRNTTKALVDGAPCVMLDQCCCKGGFCIDQSAASSEKRMKQQQYHMNKGINCTLLRAEAT